MNTFIYNLRGFQPVTLEGAVSSGHLNDIVNKNPDIILFNGVGEGRIAEALRKRYKVIGAGFVCDELTLNRNFAYNIATQAGFKIYDKKQDQSAGIRVSTEMWFRNGYPMYPAVFNIDGLVQPYKVKQPYIIQKLFKRIYILMEKAKYSGPVSADCVVMGFRDVVFWKFNACLSDYFSQVVSLLKEGNIVDYIANLEGSFNLPFSGVSYRLPDVSIKADGIDSMAIPTDKLKLKIDRLKEYRFL